MLLFGLHSHHRDAFVLLKIIHKTIFGDGACKLSAAVFCSNIAGIDDKLGSSPENIYVAKTNISLQDFVDTRRDPKYQLKASEEHAAAWQTLDPQASVHVLATVKNAVDFVNTYHTGARVIVFGGTFSGGAVRSIVLAE